MMASTVYEREIGTGVNVQIAEKPGAESLRNWRFLFISIKSHNRTERETNADAAENKFLIDLLAKKIDPEVLDFVQHCHVEFTHNPCKYSTYGQRHFNSQQQLVIDSEVGKLLQLGVISQSVHELEECLSPIFVVPKHDGSDRLIFNFKSCNGAVLFRHFKTDNLSTVINLIRPGVSLASLDLKHAY